MNLIEFRGVSYIYEESDAYAINEIDISIKKGECVAILGENGSGKTTLIKQINGLLRPTKGSVLMDGKDVRDSTIAELSKRVGFVFQNPDHMIFADTVEEELSFGPKNLEEEPKDLDKRIDEVLAFTRLESYKETHPMSLSGGEKQRLALASIIISEPEVLILDEPTTGLDYNSVNSMVSLIGRLKDSGKTIILITHDMGLVSQVAERVVLMKDGRVIRDGGLKDIFMDEEALEETFLEQPYALKLSIAWGQGFNLTPDELVNKMMEGGK